MSSDEPIEPVHRIEAMEDRRQVDLRTRGSYHFARVLENLLAWKRWDFYKGRWKSKEREVPTEKTETKQPDDHLDIQT